MGRILKRVMHRLVRALVMNRALAAVAILLVFIVIGFGVFQLLSGGGIPLAMSGGARSGSSAAENFFKGTQTYDANLVWEAYNDTSRKRLEEAGGTQAVQNQLNMARDRGEKLEDFTLVGKKDLPDGSSMHFYLVTASYAQYQGQVAYIPYVLTVDQNGKIARVQ
jgi:hypothetical protein